MGSMSKQKGSQFERLVCRRLSLWLTEGVDGDLFWRSSQSGGRATSLLKKGKHLAAVAGDICSIKSEGEAFTKLFFIECKCYKTLRLDLLIYGKQGTLVPQWLICFEQAEQYNKIPLLIFKENNRSINICVPARVMGKLLGEVGKHEAPRVTAVFPEYSMAILPFIEFERLQPPIVLQGGKDALATYGRPTPHRTKRRRLSLGAV